MHHNTYRNYCCDYTPPPPVQLNSFQAIQRLARMDTKPGVAKWAVVEIILAQPQKVWSEAEVDELLRIVSRVAA